MNITNFCYQYSRGFGDENQNSKSKFKKGTREITKNRPKALSQDWIKHHGWNVDQIRQMEDEFIDASLA